jgi:uridine kinase
MVFGANGSGKTTLGRELARILDFKRMDIEDYYFLPSEIPYTAERTREEVINLLLADIKEHGSFVLSGVTGDYGDIIPQYYKLGVYIEVPLELRLKRIEQRQNERFGERVQKGGDMYEQQLDFVDFVKSRSLSRINEWAETLTCPIIRVDGTQDWRVTAANIAEQFYRLIK